MKEAGIKTKYKVMENSNFQVEISILETMRMGNELAKAVWTSMMAATTTDSGLMVRKRVMVRINSLRDQSMLATSKMIKGMARVDTPVQKRMKKKRWSTTMDNGLKTHPMGMVHISIKMEVSMSDIMWMANAMA